MAVDGAADAVASRVPARAPAAIRSASGAQRLSVGGALALGALGGVLTGATFRVPVLGPLVFVTLLPLLAATFGGVRRAMLAGAACAATGYAVAFGWVPAWLVRFQGLPVRYAWMLFAGALAYQALQIAGFAAGVALMARRARRAALPPGVAFAPSVAALWVVLDWVFPKLVPWTLAGALAPAAWLRQAADLGGMAGLSFAIVLVNALLLPPLAPWASLGGAARRLQVRRRLVAAAAVLTTLLAYGAWRTSAGIESGSPRAVIAALLVQGGIAADQPRDDAAGLENIARYERLTDAGAATVSAEADYGLILWPETTVPLNLRGNAWYGGRLARLATRSGRSLILGAIDHAADDQGDYNSAYAFSPGASGVQIYHKGYLVPWAEYVPGRDWLPERFAWRTTGAYRHGEPPEPLILPALGSDLPPLRVAPSICFEAMQAGAFNDLVRAGAAVLVNLTDDGWLAGTAAPELHLQAMRLRAVETRRWLLRASNSGISAVIDPSGAIVASLPFGAVGALPAAAAARHDMTAYVLGGEWVVVLSAALLLWWRWRRERG